MPEKIIITIPRKKKPKRSGGGVRRGPIRTGRKSEYLSRRKTGKGINFYDLGFLLTESGLETLPFLVVPDFIQEPPSTRALNSDDITLLENLIFDVSMDQWSSKFKRINKGGISPSYAITAEFGDTSGELDDLDEWQSGGLMLDDASDLSLLLPSDLFAAIALFDGDYKYTTVRDPNADGVSFTPSTQMDIFLIPSPLRSEVRNICALGFEDDGEGASWISSAFSYLNYHWTLFPRELFLDGTLLSEISYSSGYNSSSEDVEQYTRAYESLQFNMNLPGSRGYVNRIGTEGSESSSVWEESSTIVGPAPTPPALPNDDRPPEPWGMALTIQTGGGGIPGMLLAVIRQNGTWFYVWDASV